MGPLIRIGGAALIGGLIGGGSKIGYDLITNRKVETKAVAGWAVLGAIALGGSQGLVEVTNSSMIGHPNTPITFSLITDKDVSESLAKVLANV